MVELDSQTSTELDKAWVDVISGLAEEDLVTEDIINKLIADHERAIKDHRSEIKRSQRSIENLEYKKKKLKYGNNTIIFEVAEKLELINTVNGNSPFPPAVLNWVNFDPNSGNEDVEHFYYSKAVSLISKAKDLNISIRKALKLIDFTGIELF